MLVVVAVKTKQLPVTAVWRIVVVIVIAVVNRQLVKIVPGKLARTSPAYPGVKLQGLFAVVAIPLFAVAPCFGHDLVEFFAVWLLFLWWHGGGLQ